MIGVAALVFAVAFAVKVCAEVVALFVTLRDR